jgi:DNA-directed RNA polymerase subunit RPC12/RpoP
MFTKHSRLSVWWKCHICGKEIKTEIKNYSGCAKCKKQIILDKRNLTITNPELIKEWNYNKNSSIDPKSVLSSNPQKVWWICSKCGYEWQAKISNRAVLGRGCPCCSNRVIVVGVNDLATTHPEIAKEWHPTKNKDLTPQKVTYGSNKKVWWLCRKGHEYQATIGHRTCGVGTNCPICNSGRQTSFAEQAVYYYVKKLYPDAINRYTATFLGRMELDIFIPSINYAIEYDGEPWHKGDAKLKREEKKYELCKTKNIKLVRFREEEAPLSAFIADTQFCRDRLYEHSTLEHTIQLLLERLNFKGIGCPLDVNIERDKYEILKYKYELKKDTLLDKFPDVAREWHPTKNGELKPSMFKAGTDHKVWWLCPTCGYEYEAAINKRATNKNPTACPKCGLRKVALSKSRKVNMIEPSTNKIIKTFNSIKEAGNELNINNSNIGMVCRGQRNYAGGYKWSYA